MTKRVAILGAGVGGLSAAHELASRGFSVELFESAEQVGGKAKSNRKAKSGRDGRDDLPGEHGFRFFPGFYRHLFDTMRRIPLEDGRTVLDNLIGTHEVQLARQGAEEVLMPAHFPASPSDVLKTFHALFTARLGVPAKDVRHFVGKLLQLMASCEERRFAQYERMSWWDYIEAPLRSPAFRKYFANGLTRSLVAARAERLSARTGGYILLQLLFDLAKPGAQVDRVLNAPTSDVWIQPWLDYLTSDAVAGQVEVTTGVRVEQLHFDGRRISGFSLRRNQQIEHHEEFDYYVAAVPVESMHRLVTADIRDAAPSLSRLHELETAWMNGIQYYLRRELNQALGHTLYIDSPWALTSISQLPFWKRPGFDPERIGDGSVAAILSVDISDWNSPSKRGRIARQSTRDQIRDEVWLQLKEHLNDSNQDVLRDEDLIDCHLDPAIEFDEPDQPRNNEPLLINTRGSWRYRPHAVTEIPNLMLAADYVRTHTDLATMEGANEAARRAVNGILIDSQSDAEPCGVWPLQEPTTFAPLRWWDQYRFRRNLPPPGPWTLWITRNAILPAWNAARKLRAMRNRG